jgi:Protein of unknown function (DUF2750)
MGDDRDYRSIVSISAAQAGVFFEEAVAGGAVWSIADDEGHPAPPNADGRRSMPFWSKESRAERVVERVVAYRGFRVVRIDLEVWKLRWLPGLETDGLMVGVNWSGDFATGFDIEPSEAARNLAAAETSVYLRSRLLDDRSGIGHHGLVPGTRHLHPAQLESALKRLGQIEQLLAVTSTATERGVVRWLTVCSLEGDIVLSLHECEDVGSAEFADVGEFPPVDPEEYVGEGRTIAVGASFADVVAAATAAGASHDLWVSQGMIGDEYLDRLDRS